MKRYSKKAIEFLEKRAKDRAHEDAEGESEDSKRNRTVSLLVLFYTNSPLSNYYLTSYCDWMQALGPEELKMSISYGIKPDWAVVLRTKSNVHQLAYQLHAVE